MEVSGPHYFTPLHPGPQRQPWSGWGFPTGTREALGLGEGATLTLRLVSRSGPGALARLVVRGKEWGRCFRGWVIGTPGGSQWHL